MEKVLNTTMKKNKIPNNLITGDKKILIAGYGRSGTTFLIQLLTRLGFYTGFKPFEEPIDRDIRAGAEYSYDVLISKVKDKDERKKIFDEAPFIIKSPWMSLSARKFVKEKSLDIGHVFIPVRDITDATKSRVKMGLSWFPKDQQPVKYEVEENMSAVALGRIVETCLMFRIPFSFLRFPDFVENADYCFEILVRVFGDYGVVLDRKRFDEVFSGLNKEYEDLRS